MAVITTFSLGNVKGEFGANTHTLSDQLSPDALCAVREAASSSPTITEASPMA